MLRSIEQWSIFKNIGHVTAATLLMGVKLKMSSAYHPETDGSSERSNKTVIQTLCYHVKCNQKGWAKSLPRVCFAIMNTINTSTGFSPFQLCMGRSPHLIHPLTTAPTDNAIDIPETATATALIDSLNLDVKEGVIKFFRVGESVIVGQLSVTVLAHVFISSCNHNMFLLCCVCLSLVFQSTVGSTQPTTVASPGEGISVQYEHKGPCIWQNISPEAMRAE